MTGRALAGRGRTPTAALTVAFQNTPSAIEISFRPAFAALFFISAMIVAKAGMRGADTFAQCPDGGYAAGAISKEIQSLRRPLFPGVLGEGDNFLRIKRRHGLLFTK
jgi:hypothetical protein